MASTWERMEDFHRQHNLAIPNRDEGMKAFSYLRHLMEPLWDNRARHPFENMLSWISSVSYDHLILFARKLRFLEDTEGFSSSSP